jgi:hypothetical protein
MEVEFEVMLKDVWLMVTKPCDIPEMADTPTANIAIIFFMILVIWIVGSKV